MSNFCSTCRHMLNNPDSGHCYMFKEEPVKCVLNDPGIIKVTSEQGRKNLKVLTMFPGIMEVLVNETSTKGFQS